MFKLNILGIIEFEPKKLDTKHVLERHKRVEAYNRYLSTDFINCFLVDKHHKNGYEIHCINKHGLIYIYNDKTHKLITILHSRPKQLKRYYQAVRVGIPKRIYKLCKEVHKRNEQNDLNNQ